MRRGLAVLWIWGPLALYVFTIFYLSSQSDVGWLATYPDYVMHPIEYCGLSILVVRALNDGLSRPASGRILGTAFLLCVACGMLDEAWQYFTPNRLSDWLDVVKDAVGAAAGVGLLRLADPILHRRPAA